LLLTFCDRVAAAACVAHANEWCWYVVCGERGRATMRGGAAGRSSEGGLGGKIEIGNRL